MKQSIGERLAKYRKKNNLSQEELAFKLDVSRQAVSKWERDEASPDTNNLIALAKIYNVTLDELLYKDPEEVKPQENIKEEKEEQDENTSSNIHVNFSGVDIKDDDGFVHVGPDGVHIKDDTDEIRISSCQGHIFVNNYSQEENTQNKRMNVIKSVLEGSGYLLVTIIYLILGFLLPDGSGWAIYWTLYFIPDILVSFINCFIRKKVGTFNISFVSAFIYLFLGMYLNIWHPTWIIFLAIPLFYVIVKPIDIAIHKAILEAKKEENVVETIKE